jgi:sugar phosphate isomerase/epimerase
MHTRPLAFGTRQSPTSPPAVPQSFPMFPSFNPGHVGIQVSLGDGLALAERHGFGGFDAQLRPLHDEVTQRGAAAVRDAFIARGLRPGAWNLPFMPTRVGADEWRAGLAGLPNLLASARAVGATRGGMWILPGSDEREFDANFAFHVERFQPVARLLADHGLRLGLEFIGPETSAARFRHRFIRSVDGMLGLARAIGPNCGLLLDAWHWHAAGGTRQDLRALTRELLVHIHVDDAPDGVARGDLVDNRRKLPGVTGVIDLEGFMQALAEAGYDGPVTAEPFDAELSALPPEESAARTARATRAAVARAVRPTERAS